MLKQIMTWSRLIIVLFAVCQFGRANHVLSKRSRYCNFTRAIGDMLNYTDMLFPTSSPNVEFYMSPYVEKNICDIMYTYKILIDKSVFLKNKVDFETRIDILFNQWGETWETEPKMRWVSYTVLILFTLMVCSKKRTLTPYEHARFNYDPVFRMRYLTGKD